MSLITPTRGPFFLPNFKWLWRHSVARTPRSKARKKFEQSQNPKTNHDSGFRLHRPYPLIDYEEQIHTEQRANLQGADDDIATFSATVTPGAGKNVKIESILDIDTILDSLLTSDDGQHCRVSRYTYEAEIYSSDYFKAYFYCLISENGSTFTAQEKDTNTQATAMRALIASGEDSEYKLVPLGVVKGKSVALDSNNMDYRTHFTMDLTQIAQSYIKTAEEAVYSGDVLPEVEILMGVISLQSNTAVVMRGFRSINSYDINS